MTTPVQAPGRPGGVYGWGGVLAFLRSHPGSIGGALALAGLLVLFGALRFISLLSAGPGPADLELWAAAAVAAVAVILFYARLMRTTYDLATADIPGLGALPAAGGGRLVAQLGILGLILAPLARGLSAVLPVPLVVVLVGLLAQWLSFFAPQAAVVEDRGAFRALLRSARLVLRHPAEALSCSLALTGIVGLPAAAAVALGSGAAPPAGAFLGPKDLDLTLLLALGAGVLSLTLLLLVPPVSITLLYLALVPPRGAAPRAARARSLAREQPVAAPAGAVEPAPPATGTAGDLFNQAMGLIAAGQPDRAIELFQAAAEREPAIASGPRYATACLALAETFARKGRRELAVNYYEAYLQHNPHGMNRNSILRRIEALRSAASPAR